MREVDHLTTERFGIPSIILMENAAHAVARVINDKLNGAVVGKSILILCGPGNNGGDGAALARILWTSGANVNVVLFGSADDANGDAGANFRILRDLSDHSTNTGAETGDKADAGELYFKEAADDEFQGINDISLKADVVVDALFGTGLSRPLDAKFSKLIRDERLDASKERNYILISVDIPSGLSSDDPEPLGSTVKADITVTFTVPKPANVLPPATHLNGELIVADIGSPAELINAAESCLFVAGDDDVRRFTEHSKFDAGSYKNKRGHALIIAGSENYAGAAVLAANGAMRSGVGLVTIVTPHSAKEMAASRVLPEVMVRSVSETEDGAISFDAISEIGELLEKADGVTIGCGLSQNDSTRKFVQAVIEMRTHPTVVDADALNLLSPFRGEALKTIDGPPLILTPHEGEFMRLLGTTDKQVINDRVAAVRNFAREHNVILVLKGERVLIGCPDGRVIVNPTGNSGLGKAGNGDTLAGILGGFITQSSSMHIGIVETVIAAVYAAGLAGDIAEKKYGKRVMTASDVRECLAEVFARFGK